MSMSKKMLGDLMRQAQVIQEKMAKTQEQMAGKMVDASSGGGMVTVVANGKQEIVSVKIDPEIMGQNDKEMIEDLILAAVNEALRKSRDLVAEEMKGITGGIGIPGLF
ncbi:MAG: YbaB/EbfC family nucleoid-associated protein [Nitrospirota bacterium]